MDKFRQRLRNDVKDLLLTFHKDPKSFTEAISRAVQCDNRLLERRSERQQMLRRCRVVTRVRVERRDHGGLRPGRDGCREANPLRSNDTYLGTNKVIPDTYRKPPRTRERRLGERERERESRRATPTQSTPRMYREQGKGNARDTDRDSNARFLIYICINKRVIHLRLRAKLNRFGYNNSLLPSRRSGSSRAHHAELGSCIGDRAVA